MLFEHHYNTAITKDRFIGFLIWQSIPSTFIYLLSKTLIFSLSSSPTLFSIIPFSLFHVSLLLSSTSLSLLSSPYPHPPASFSSLSLSLVKFIFVPGYPVRPDFRRRVRVSMSFVLFVVVSAVWGSVLVVCLCWRRWWVGFGGGAMAWQRLIGVLGFRGFVVGGFYGLWYVYKRRWVLEFPIVQRPPFFNFKMRIPSAIGQALKLSIVSYLFSAMLAVFLPNTFKSQVTLWKLIAEEIIFYIGCFLVFLCWELSHHLHQVLHTKRFIFAPPKGSAAAETNPSEPLLAALEESTPKSLLQYLAYLDLCIVCERNVDTWRRAAFFEETGETYKRVVAACLRPLEEFTSKLNEHLESFSADNSVQLSHQIRSPRERLADSRLYEPFDDFQLCEWCARIVASLTIHSHKEDRFGVAQLSGSNAAVVSTLLSCLLAVETLMGKRTNLQSPPHMIGPAGIKWATLSTEKRETAVSFMGKKRGGPLYSKAYSMADILRTSIYCVVSAFHDEMLHGAKGGLLEKDWIISSKPIYGTRELLSHKLRLFLDFRAS